MTTTACPRCASDWDGSACDGCGYQPLALADRPPSGDLALFYRVDPPAVVNQPHSLRFKLARAGGPKVRVSVHAALDRIGAGLEARDADLRRVVKIGAGGREATFSIGFEGRQAGTYCLQGLRIVVEPDGGPAGAVAQAYELADDSIEFSVVAGDGRGGGSTVANIHVVTHGDAVGTGGTVIHAHTGSASALPAAAEPRWAAVPLDGPVTVAAAAVVAPVVERTAVIATVSSGRIRDGDVTRTALGVPVTWAAGTPSGNAYVGGPDGITQLLAVDRPPVAIDVGMPVDRFAVWDGWFVVQNRQGIVVVHPATGRRADDIKYFTGTVILGGSHDGMHVLGMMSGVANPPYYSTVANAWAEPGGPDVAFRSGGHFNIHRSPVAAAAMGRTLGASGDTAGYVLLTGQVLTLRRTVGKPVSFGAAVAAVAISPDEARVAVVGRRARVMVLNGRDGSAAMDVPVPGRSLTAVQYFDAGDLLAVGSDAGAVTIVNAEDGTPVWAGPVADGGGRRAVVALLADCGGADLTAVCDDGSVLTINLREVRS